MDRKHFKCLFWKGLWALGVLSLILAWISTKTGFIWGHDAQTWFWDALVLGVLAIPIKLDCHACNVCMPEGSK